MKAAVKIVWSDGPPELLLSSQEGLETVSLERGRELDMELSAERRCIGYHSAPGTREPCPGFHGIETGDQCRECRNRDVYSGWSSGNDTPDFEADYSVYLAQCGKRVKVGVARTSRLQTRWREQGADFAAELESGLDAEEALDREKEISTTGIDERIRKESKVKEADSRLIRKKLDELGASASIEQVNGNSLRATTLAREGRFPSPVKHVKGQIISNGRIGLAITSGKVVREPTQQTFTDF